MYTYHLNQPLYCKDEIYTITRLTPKRIYATSVTVSVILRRRAMEQQGRTWHGRVKGWLRTNEQG